MISSGKLLIIEVKSRDERLARACARPRNLRDGDREPCGVWLIHENGLLAANAMCKRREELVEGRRHGLIITALAFAGGAAS